MTETKQNPVVHLLPSLTDVAFLMPLIFMFGSFNGAKALLGDGDTGWHIRTGEWILANGRVPRTDLFSFTKPGARWFAWEWLSDVIFGWLHQHWGLAGVVLLGMLLLCSTSALLFRLVRRRCSNPLIAIIVTVIAIASSCIHWHARPHLFTIFFTVVFLYILDHARSGSYRWLIALPFLTALWTNLHGGFFVGLLMISCYVGGELIASALASGRKSARTSLFAAGRYAAVLVGCLAATVLNPYGIQLHLFIVHFLGQPFIHAISEYLPPNFHEVHTRFYEAVLIPGLAAAYWSVTKRRFDDALLLVGWAHLSLFASRNVPIFVMGAAPILAAAADEIVARLQTADLKAWFRSLLACFTEIGGEIAELDRAWRVHAVSAVIFVCVALAIVSGRLDAKYSATFDPERFPVDAAEVLAVRPSAPRVFTIDQWADYLIYRLYPNWRVFYDGRADMYGAEFFKNYGKIVNAGQDWQQDLKKYGVESVLLPVDVPLVGALKESREWRPVYDDHRAILFDRVGGRQQISSALIGESTRDQRVTDGNIRDRAITATIHHDHLITSRKPI